MKFLLSLGIITCSLNLLSAGEIFLDDVMSKHEQRITGVNKLSATQKIELERWINKTFVLKGQNELQPSEKALSLSFNIDNGHKLELSDNSIWEIAPGDVIRASAWITPFPIQLSSSHDPEYPYLITNTVSGDSVKARRWTENQTAPSP